jgi:hypothetical protein
MAYTNRLHADSPEALEESKKLTPEDNKTILDSDKAKARYKIEVHFGKDRTTLGLCTCAILIWESGKRFHGGGDEKMYWCGYKDCSKPIRSSAFGPYHAVCPHCQRECFLDPESRAMHIKKLKNTGQPLNGIDMLPLIVGEKLMKVPAMRIAEFMTHIWHQLECDADIYLKYHPSDIRFNLNDPDGKLKVIDTLDNARTKRGLMIYPLKNILKDVSAGADVTKRFLSMITA